jgi:hypothetical protein
MTMKRTKLVVGSTLLAGALAATNGCGINGGSAEHDRTGEAVMSTSAAITTGSGPAPGCNTTAHMTRNGGLPMQGTVNLVPVLWTNKLSSSTQTTLSQFYPSLAASSDAGGYMSFLHSEYGAARLATSPMPLPVTITPTVSKGTTLNADHGDIQNELAAQIQSGTLSPGPISSVPQYLYVVHVPSGYSVIHGGGTLCVPNSAGFFTYGFHGQFSHTFQLAAHLGSFTANVTFAVIADQCANETAGTTHEVAEALTNPNVNNGWYDFTQPNSQFCEGGMTEIGDLCANQTADVALPIPNSFSTQTFTVQKLWSNRGNNCFTGPAAQGDLNGDGASDLVLTGGLQQGNFQPWESMPAAMAILGQPGVFTGTNGGQTSGSTPFATDATIAGVKPVAGDFNADGLADVALVGGQGWQSIPIAFSNGDGTYHVTNRGIVSGDTGFTTTWAPEAAVKAVSGDFNGDGRDDIALVGGIGWQSMPIAFSNGDGTFNVVNQGETSGDTSFPTRATVSGAVPVSGDFDGDGRADIALVGGAGWTGIPIAFSNGNDGTFHGTFLGETSGDTGFLADAVVSGAKAVAGDFNGDGLADIALTGGANWMSIPIAFSNGDGTFSGTNKGVISGDQNFTADAAMSGVKAVSGDFNDDGIGDIALVGGAGWTTIPVAFGVDDGSFGAISGSEPFGDTGFTVDATLIGAKPVSR